MLKISHTFITNKSESEKMNEDFELESVVKYVPLFFKTVVIWFIIWHLNVYFSS